MTPVLRWVFALCVVAILCMTGLVAMGKASLSDFGTLATGIALLLARSPVDWASLLKAAPSAAPIPVDVDPPPVTTKEGKRP